MNDTEYYRTDQQGDEMLSASVHCSRFSRRHDFNTFNMGDYQSCENCRHLDSESRCMLHMQEDRSPFGME